MEFAESLMSLAVVESIHEDVLFSLIHFINSTEKFVCMNVYLCVCMCTHVSCKT